MPVSLLIIGSRRKTDGVRKRLAGRALLWGLEQREIRWQIYQPGTDPVPDLGEYDALLAWSFMVYRLSRAYLPVARELEAQALARGIPVINSVQRCDAPHSFFLETWREHGIPCARCQGFERVEDLELDYPLLLRRDGVHRGEDLYFVRTPEDARRLVRDREKDGKEPLNLAVEFVDARDRNGLYSRYRSWVVGDVIIPISVLVSDHWMVNYSHFDDDEVAARYGRDFLDRGEPNAAEVRAAARLTGSDVVALDYARCPEGRYVFWEANRHFLTLEDYGETPSGGFTRATGVDAAGRRKAFEDLGWALADLVVERATTKDLAKGGVL